MCSAMTALKGGGSVIVRGRCGAAAVLAALLVVSGCSSDPGPTTTTPPPTPPASPRTPSPSTSPDPTAGVSAAVLAAYLNFQHAVADAQRTANAHSKQLEKYGADKALAQARVFLIEMDHSGVVFRGAPAFDPVVTRLELGEQRSGWVRDCVDGTNWKPIYKATGKSALAPGQNPRAPAQAWVWWNGERWVVRTLTVDRSKTC